MSVRHEQSTSRNVSRGFSLIEVMLAVFILALGLLGLGAVIPVVLNSQRESVDASLGVSAINNARAYLEARPDLNRLTSDPNATPYGFGTWVLAPNPGWSPTGLWEPITADQLDRQTGEMVFGTGSSRVRIPVGDRLWPTRAIAREEPRFVWDFIARRLPTSDVSAPAIQIAMFVRRVDPNIRVPEGQRLVDLLDGTITGSSRRVPVGVVDDGVNPRPTLNGTGQYSTPRVIAVRYDADQPGLIRLQGGTTLERDLARQIGQKLIDNLGNIHTVRQLDPQDGQRLTLLVDPPVPAWVASTTAGGASAMVEVAFVPQIPSSVEVFNLSIVDPVESPSGSGTGSQLP